MKKEIAIITDSTTHLTKEYCKENDIYIASVQLTNNTHSYREIDVTADWFYEMLENKNNTLKTSQPSIGEIVELYEDLLQKYKKILVFSLSSKVSGTYQAFMTAKKIVAPLQITVFDTETAGIAKDIQITQAVQLLQEGTGINKVLQTLHQVKKEFHFFVIPADLEQLHNSGRLKASQFLVGSLLQIKPIIIVKDGLIEVHDKVRTHKKIKKWIFEKLADIQDEVVPHLYLYGTYDDEDELEGYKEELLKLYPSWEITILSLPYTLALHVGQGTKGFVMQKKS